jgi:hypothetical protein
MSDQLYVIVWRNLVTKAIVIGSPPFSLAEAQAQLKKIQIEYPGIQCWIEQVKKEKPQP